mgnify:CR=1 FL=1
MIIAYLTILCVITALNMPLLYRINSRQSGPFQLIFFAIFTACLGHLLLALSANIDQAIVANKMIYLGSLLLPLLTFDVSVSICKIRFPTWGHAILMLSVFVILALSLTVGFNGMYYKSIEFVHTSGVGNFVATYGWGHDIFNVMMVGFVIANISLLLYAFLKKNNVSLKSLAALTLLEFASILSLFTSRFLESDTLVMPAIYVFDQFIMIYICYRVKRYDVEQNVSNALEIQNSDGYILLNPKGIFLGCNQVAYDMFPALRENRIDSALRNNSKLGELLLSWNKELHEGKIITEKTIEADDKHYRIKLRQLPLSGNINFFKIEDDTNLHNYINMLGSNNVRLELMLKENDLQIQSIQEQILIGMAHMVESRDSNTGSHIKRTSKVVQILVDYLRKDSSFEKPDSFYDALVAAAPMHDIGKIAIDDRILRKPGRFTPQEYEEMKSHPEKGAMIVENLLTSIESPEFVTIARNVARYHHERYDGFGYPKKLKGTEIPFEARVMAIADVYDALVSKRCYKAEMSFEDAYNIITEGMGTQFDPLLKECFIACREKLEEYYSSLKENEA